MSEKKINNKKNINNQNNKNKGKSTGEKSKKPVIIGVIAIAVIIVATVIVLALTGVFGEEEKKDAEFGKTKIPETICQYTPPVEGEITAEIYVKDYGVIKVKFFETIAPKAVENFVTHAKEGYYDGVTFHRIIEDFMIQGGDPEGTGYGGESIWGEPFEDEFSTKLMPLRGALCMANSGTNTNSSQFFIVQSTGYQIAYVKQLRQIGVDDDVVDYYKENGGAAWLYNLHTVFGQVYEGMDVVDEIAAVAVGGANNDTPLEKVVIEKILIKEY